jgi:hypothetical protein
MPTLGKRFNNFAVLDTRCEATSFLSAEPTHTAMISTGKNPMFGHDIAG